MGYDLPISMDTKVDPLVLEWEKDLPEDIKRNRGLRDFLVRMAPRIYDNIGGANYDPFYKIVEILKEDKLYYNSLKVIRRYYGIDLIRFLIENEELCEMYLGYICTDEQQLKSALGERKNKTDKYTLTRILQNRI